MLNVILWLPLAVALVGFLLPRTLVGWWAVAGSLGSLALAIALIFEFQTGSGALQHTVSESWIPDLGIRYELGVDGLSLFMILLTGIGWLAANLYSAFALPDTPRTYFFHMGLAQTAVAGAFLAQDLLLFVLFFDLMLIPFYFLIGGWGTGDRVAATIKMIVFTLIGSLLMLIAAIATGVLTGIANDVPTTFNIQALASAPLELGSQQWIFWFFAAAFLVKMPAFLVHGWMADAYRACPLPVLALLSGVLSKVATYGFLRVVLPVFPDATIQYQEVVLIIAVVSIIYGSAMAFTQTNVRLIAGYSSIAQLGFITLGIFALRPDGADGSVIQMFNHGLVVIPLFLIIALLYERFGTEDLTEMGGMAKRAPILAVLFMIVTMATLAIPGSANFVGEFYILNGLFQTKIALALIASVGIALAAFYALRLYQRSMHNRLPVGVESREITLAEGLVIVPLVVCIIAIALYPGLITERGEASVNRSVAAVAAADCGNGESVGLAGEQGTGDAPLEMFDPACVASYGLGESEGEAEAEPEPIGDGAPGEPGTAEPEDAASGVIGAKDAALVGHECVTTASRRLGNLTGITDLGVAFENCGLGAEDVSPVNGEFPEGWVPVDVSQNGNIVNKDLEGVIANCEFYVDPEGAGAAGDPRCLKTEAPKKALLVRRTPQDCLIFLVAERLGGEAGNPSFSVSGGFACP